MRKGVILWAGLLTLAFASCADDVVDAYDDAACIKMLKNSKNVDAIDWLKTPSGSKKLKAGTTDEEALALAVKLQEYGAALLIAEDDAHPGDSMNHDQGMIVKLPDDLRQRGAIFRLYAKQSRNAGVTPLADTGQQHLFLYWTPTGRTSGVH